MPGKVLGNYLILTSRVFALPSRQTWRYACAMQSAAKVGLLLVVFVGLLIGGYAMLGKSLFAPPSDVYFVELSDAGGISEGTQVLMAGVAIGSVSSVKLMSPTLARIKLDIVHGTHIPLGSVAQLPTSLIGFGESPVTIVPPVQTTTDLLHSGATLHGTKGSPLDGFLPEGRQTVAELNKTMIAFRKLLEDEKLQSRVSDLLATSNKTIERFGNLAHDASTLIGSNQANIGRAIVAATAAIEDVHKVTAQVAEMLREGKLQKDAVAIMDRIKTISQHADEMVQSLNKMVNDPKLREPIAKTAANMADITNTGKTIATNVADMTKNGTTITENAAVVSKKAIGLTDKATEIATKASEIEDQLKGVLDKVGGFFNKAPTSANIPKITTEMDLLRQSQPGYWRSDVSLSFPLQDSTVHLGLYDALESNKLIVELGRNITDKLGFRYGVYASSASFGVDYLLAPRLSLRGDAWDINDPRLDLRTSYEFGNGFIGWLGVDRAFKDNAVSFGIGIRK